jgi:hypothetical protein
MVDKYSLLRVWRTPSELDDGITKISRGHMALAVYAHTVTTLIFYAEFPFDNICGPIDGATLSWHVYRDAKKFYNVTTDVIHQPCNQMIDRTALSIFLGGSIERKSMYGRQRRVVRLYVYLVLSMSAVLFVSFFGRSLILGTCHLFYGSYQFEADANADQFSECEITAFIPNITHPNLAFPLIATAMDSFETKYLAFTMPDELYVKQCLCQKAELPGFTDAELRKLFSEVKYYPPPQLLLELSADPNKIKYARISGSRISRNSSDPNVGGMYFKRSSRRSSAELSVLEEE